MQLSPATFRFPIIQSTVLPDPSLYFAPKLLHAPLPTNAFFQNFVLKNGSQPEYIHPYLIKSTLSILSICYPSLFQNTSVVTQIFSPDLSISAVNRRQNRPRRHAVSAFSDLSVTLDHPDTKLRFYLVRGSPFLTCRVRGNRILAISTIHAIKQISCSSRTKCTIKLNNKQIWVLYSSSPIDLKQSNVSAITTSVFSGVIRIAALPDSDSKTEEILDRFSSCYPVSGRAFLSKPFSVEYRWKTRGSGDLLMLAHPLHLQLLSKSDSSSMLKSFKYQSIDGDLVGVVGDSWILKTDPISVTWHSIGGVLEKESQEQVINALVKDVKGLSTSPISTNSSYFYGKLVARAARLALIAEEVCYLDVIPAIKKYLKRTIEPWLEGTIAGNAFLHDPIWGGMVTKAGSLDPAGDFGFGIYNDHHYHLGYFVYGMSVLAKLDPAWGKKYKQQAYSMVSDYMTSTKSTPNSTYTRLRNFDPWLLHSWAAGLTEFPNGRNQESTSEAVNAYYSAALMGLTYGDDQVLKTGSTLLAMEILAAKTWWHVEEDDSTLYGKKFTNENRVVGILWANQRDSGLWFAPPEWRECRLGIQVLPLLPVTEVLFSDVEYAEELVTWASTVFGREGAPVGEGWKGFIFALEGIYDGKSALKNVMGLKEHDDGNSLTNLLWWIHSRGKGKNGKVCWYGAP